VLETACYKISIKNKNQKYTMVDRRKTNKY